MRLTPYAARILLEMLRAGDEPLWGLALSKRLGITSGNTYTVLGRLTEEGIVTVRTEEIDPSEVQRPARRYYTMDSEQREKARSVIAQFRNSGALEAARALLAEFDAETDELGEREVFASSEDRRKFLEDAANETPLRTRAAG